MRILDRDNGIPAVLLMAYGSPNSLDEVADYLSEVRGGRGSSLDDVEHLKNRYQRVGGRTPLLQITKAQSEALEKKLVAEGLPARVSYGMKHWHPFIEDVVEKVDLDNPSALIGLALAPHYSKLSIGGYEDSVRRAASADVRTSPSGSPVAPGTVLRWGDKPLRKERVTLIELHYDIQRIV